MSNTKRFWLPFASYDIRNIEHWLQEKAEQGFVLKKMKPYFPVFLDLEGTASVKYHLEPTVKDRSEPTQEVIETRAQRGWTYAGTMDNMFHVFYADKNEKSFYATPSDVIQKYQEKLRKRRHSLLFLLPLSLLALSVDLIDFYNSESMLQWIFLNLSYYHVMLILFVLYSGVVDIIDYIKLKQFAQSFEYPEDKETSSRLYKVFRLSANMTVVLFTGVILFYLLQGNTSETGLMNNEVQHISEIQGAYPIEVLATVTELKKSCSADGETTPDPFIRTSSSLLIEKQMFSYSYQEQAYSNIDISVNFFGARNLRIIESFKNLTIDDLEEYKGGDFQEEMVEGIKLHSMVTEQDYILLMMKEKYMVLVTVPVESWQKSLKSVFVESFMKDVHRWKSAR